MMTNEEFRKKINTAHTLKEALELIKKCQDEERDLIIKMVERTKKLSVKEQREKIYDMIQTSLECLVVLQYQLESINQLIRFSFPDVSKGKGGV